MQISTTLHISRFIVAAFLLAKDQCPTSHPLTAAELTCARPIEPQGLEALTLKAFANLPERAAERKAPSTVSRMNAVHARKFTSTMEDLR
jgi:hypothetical protein